MLYNMNKSNKLTIAKKINNNYVHLLRDGKHQNGKHMVHQL